MKNYTITVNGTAYEVCVEEAGAVAAAPKAAQRRRFLRVSFSFGLARSTSFRPLSQPHGR